LSTEVEPDAHQIGASGCGMMAPMRRFQGVQERGLIIAARLAWE
jgi:hypothetical protein